MRSEPFGLFKARGLFVRDVRAGAVTLGYADTGQETSEAVHSASEVINSGHLLRDRDCSFHALQIMHGTKVFVRAGLGKR